MIRPRTITIVSSSSPRVVPPPLQMRHAGQMRVSGGTVVALVMMVAVYALVGWLAVRKRDVASQATAAAHAAGTWSPPALKADLERHPCNGCAP